MSPGTSESVSRTARGIVVWHFETLPHWAHAALAVREVVQLAYGQWALRHDIDLLVPNPRQ